jgi:ribonuclease HI
MLRDNGGYAYYSHCCCGSTSLPPPLELVVQREAQSTAHRLWILGCWSYLHHNSGHSSILVRLRQSDPIFNMGVDNMKPAFNLQPKYRVTMLTRENCTKGTGTPLQSKGSSGSQMGPGGGRAGVYGQSVGRRLSFSLGRDATVIQAEIYAILVCVHEIQLQNRPEKCVSICSDSQAALKALKAVRTTSLLVRQCQRALNDISVQHAVGLFWVPGHAGVRGNERVDELARSGPALNFFGPEPALGVSRLVIQRRLGCWFTNQHWARWRGLRDTLR